jgi:hypothetical protein
MPDTFVKLGAVTNGSLPVRLEHLQNICSALVRAGIFRSFIDVRYIALDP